MEQKSNIEILQEFATNTNRKINFKEEQYPISVYRKIPRYRRSVIIPNNSNETSYYILYGDPYNKIGEYTVFCGVYFPIDIPLTIKLNFRQKDILDKLNPFLSKKIIKTENWVFDSKVITTGKDLKIIQHLFKDDKLCSLMIEAFKMNVLLNFSINETNVDFVTNLEGKSHFCLYNRQQWILEDSIIEKWFEITENIRELLMKKQLYNNI